jgi:hypothetical protein
MIPFNLTSSQEVKMSRNNLRRAESFEENEQGGPTGRKVFLSGSVVQVNCETLDRYQKYTQKGIVIPIEKSLVLTVQDEENKSFLQDRNNEGVIDDLVSLIRVAWNNYNIGDLISLVQQSTQERRELLEGII